MGGTGVIDRFLEVFTSYIDSGFGLLGSEVGFLAATLAAIDLTLAALFWAWGRDEDVIARLVKKTLFIGVFAYLIGNWNSLSRIVFESFAGLGLKASGTGLSAADFLRPGRVAQVGLDAGRPLLESISGLMGYISFFENFIQIVVLLFAWIVVLLAFFILAVQLFITLIEFKLTTLAGFVLIPFGLFSKTAFLAERVLGNVVSSGVKVLVLAVIVGIGSTLFSQFTSGTGAQPSIEDAMALVLASLALLGLGIFGPGIANGIVSGGPQLGAGAAVGAGLAAGGLAAAGGGPRHRRCERAGRCRGRGRPGNCRPGRWRRDCLPRRRSFRRDRVGRIRRDQPAPPGGRKRFEQLRSRRAHRCRRCRDRRCGGSAGRTARLGAAHEAEPGRKPRRFRRNPRRPVRRSRRWRRLHRPF